MTVVNPGGSPQQTYRDRARRSCRLTTWVIGEPRLLRGLDSEYRLSLRAHRAVHGELLTLSRAELVTLAESVNLLGRGGAGFPVAAKLRALPRSGARAVIVNGNESEPASAKDRLLMRRAPHLVLDGLALASRP